MITHLQFRPYNPSHDQSPVMELFRSNLNPYFTAEEEAEFRHFLSENFPYFVGELETEQGKCIVASGGYAMNARYAVLTWGMVARQFHGQGIGRAFIRFRINECREAYPNTAIEIETSQHTAPFYEKLGFRTLSIQPDKWGPNLHLVHMLFDADATL
ncbi:GNAT family N-acetyltransferase [bacterium]|nr:MAG: GNAT family N-acetyltransferase [bacterium]